MGDASGEIAGFRLESEIGRGGMGVVYLATQTYPERRVALKVLSPDIAEDPGFRERFIRESNAAASLEHPNIVPIYSAGEDDGRLYLAMRYVEGTDLRALLAREGALSPERAARICAEVADALEAAHERGLVHRDVKPGNVLLDARDRAYLSDFGLIRPTRIDTELTRTGQLMGSLEYVAPEQIRGDPVDGRADVYSLGCVLFECLTGHPPFHRENEVATLYAHLEEPPPRPGSIRPGVPVGLGAVAERAMAKRPGDRYATAEDMAQALRGGPPATVVSGRRRRGLVAVAAAAVIAIAGAAVWASARDGASEIAATGPTTAEAPIPPGSLVQLDTETGAVVSTTQGFGATKGDLPVVDVGEGAAWVLGAGTLSRVEVADGAVAYRITLGNGIGINSLTTAERIVWVSATGGLDRVSASDGAVLRPVDIGHGGTILELYVAGGSGAVWAVTGDGQLSRVDPQTAEITGEVDTGPSATDVTAGFDTVWIADDLHGTVTRVDAGTLTLDVPIEIPGGIDDVEAGAGSVWVLDSDAGVVTPIDPDAGTLGPPVRVGTEPTDLASGLGSLWVANHGDGTVSRIDPVTGSVETFDVGAPVATLSVDESARRVWVTVATTSS